jgi:glycopeptide antibiotics resistance protein
MSASTPFPTRGSYFALACAFAAFAIYGSLLPFDFQPVPVAAAWDQFRAAVLRAPSTRVSRTDLLANILLFVPIGFTLAGALVVDRRRLALLPATPAILAGSIGVSTTAEFLQMFALRRVPSNIDLAAQTVGCLVGITAWLLVGPALTAWIRATLVSTGEERLPRLLVAFAAGWMFVNLAPFDITVDVGDLAERVRDGEINLVPFGSSGLPLARRVWDAVAEVLSTVPVGALALVGFSSSHRRTAATAFSLGAAVVLFVEVAQVFINSHTADATDLIFGVAGVALGVAIATKWLPDTIGAISAAPARRISWTSVGLIVIWCAWICSYHWYPYDFDLNGEEVRRKLGRISLLPFAGYAEGSYINSLNNTLVKSALAAPLGLLASFVHPINSRPSVIGTAAALVFAAGVLGAVETGQLLLHTRVPDPTDVLVGVLATYAGLRIGRWLQSGRGA